LNALFFMLTVLTAFHSRLPWGARLFSVPLTRHDILDASLYCATLLAILVSHELGHYLMCRRHGVDSTLPFFIPFPKLAADGMGFGTLGAVILMDERIPTRRSLFDIGAAGPLAGLAVAMPALVIGVINAEIRPMGAITQGNSILIELLIGWTKRPLLPGEYLALGPVGYAAWVGIFITGMNLIPLGQLDGGHVLYGILGPKAHAVSGSLFVIAAIVSTVLCPMPWLMLLSVIVVSSGLFHKPTMSDDIPLDWTRKALGAFVLTIFILTFIPEPVRLNDIAL